MKILDRKQVPQSEIIQKPFVGRKIQQERFWKEFNIHRNISQDWTVSVLNYYGMGGIGKSELANALSNALSDSSVEHIFFTFSDEKSFMENMIELRNLLFHTAKLSFVYFDAAYIAYCSRSGHSPSELARKSILNSRYMSALTPILGVLPGRRVNIAAAAVQALAPFEKELGRHFQEENFDFCHMSPDKLYDRLQYYFLLDLKEGVQGRQEPLPVILDNLDARILYDTMEFKRWFLSDRGLIQNLPNIIWNLFSREKIPEGEFPEKVLQCIPMEEFSYEETVEYLKACGMEPQFWQQIYSLTEGIPLYLYICIEDYYIQVRQRQEVRLSQIGTDKGELIYRFLKHLNPDQKKVLQLMTFLEMWREDVFLAFLDAMKVDENAYYEMREKTFIKKYGDRYHLHNVVVKAIREYMIPAYYKRLKKAYESVVDSMGLESVETELLKAKMSVYELNTDEELEIYIFSLAALFERYEQELEFNYVYSLHGTICERLLNYSGRILALSLSYYYYGLLLRKMGNVSKALEQMQVAYQLTCDIAKPAVMKEEAYQQYILNIKSEYANLLYLNDRYEEALELRQVCWSEAKRQSGKDSFEAMSCMQNLAKQYIDGPKYRDTGIHMLTKIIKYREKNDLLEDYQQEMNERYRMYAQMDLATAYAAMGEYERAIEYGISAVTEMAEKYGEADYDTKIYLEVFSNILMQIRAYDVVIDILKKTFMEWKEIMDDDSRVLQSLKYNLGIAYGECGHFEEGKQLLKELYEYSYDTLGAYHKITLRNKKQYAIILAQEGNHTDAIEMLSDCMETYLDCYGMDGSAQLLHLYSSLTLEYRMVHDDNKMKQLQNEVLQADNWEGVSDVEKSFLEW